MILAPGTILQLMYLRERLKRRPCGQFIEVGPGSGEVTSLLLQLGWSGRVFELSPVAAEHMRRRFSSYIGAGRLTVEAASYLHWRTASGS